jgi:hypothetical protein
MSRLYQYTSVNGLKGIVDSGNIHATHLGFLNDLSEGRVAVPRDHETYRKRLEELDRRSPVFVASFCRHEEPYQARNGLLSQWRGYAGMGGGYCVVLDEAVLDELVAAEQKASPELVMMKRDIRYVSEAQEAEVPDEPQKFLDRLAFVKSEAFAEEHETRIMMAAPHGGPRRIRFRSSEEMLVPYVAIFGEPKRLPITGIIVGPGPLQRRCAAGVVQFLRAHGLGVEVTLSGIPLAR